MYVWWCWMCIVANDFWLCRQIIQMTNVALNNAVFQVRAKHLSHVPECASNMSNGQNIYNKKPYTCIHARIQAINVSLPFTHWKKRTSVPRPHPNNCKKTKMWNIFAEDQNDLCINLKCTHPHLNLNPANNRPIPRSCTFSRSVCSSWKSQRGRFSRWYQRGGGWWWWWC